ncbi:hypothetical protein U1Q18_007462 [Sarracenia purpurea var. burkii]
MSDWQFLPGGLLSSYFIGCTGGDGTEVRRCSDDGPGDRIEEDSGDGRHRTDLGEEVPWKSTEQAMMELVGSAIADRG